MQTHTLTIVGAGPAGSSLAFFAASLGIKTTLIDKQLFPRSKPCGCAISKRAIDLLNATGIGECPYLSPVESAAFFEKTKNIFSCSSSPLFSGKRELFDDWLCKKAVNAGAIFLPDENAIKYYHTDTQITLITNKRTINSTWLAVATGCLDTFSLRNGFLKPKSIAAISQELSLPLNGQPNSTTLDTTRFDFGVVDNGYAWCFPKAESLSVGILTICKGVNLRSALDSYKKTIGIDTLNILRTAGHPIPCKQAKQLCNKNVFLVGDAAGFADPLTFEGIYYAILSSKLLSRALHSKCKAGTNPNREYHKTIKQEITGELRTASILSNIIYRSDFVRYLLFNKFGKQMGSIVSDIFEGKRKYKTEFFCLKNWFRFIVLLLTLHYKRLLRSIPF